MTRTVLGEVAAMAFTIGLGIVVWLLIVAVSP